MRVAERWIGTLRREGLHHLLITGPRHLAVVLGEHVQHYNTHCPTDRSDSSRPQATHPTSNAAIQPLRRDRLGGLIHEYLQVAWRDELSAPTGATPPIQTTAAVTQGT
jgi:hypothetical protein